MKRNIAILLLALAFPACKNTPGTDIAECDRSPAIFPDYTGVVIPRNLAPANFIIDSEADAYYTVLSNGNEHFAVKGRKVAISEEKWQKLTSGTENSIGVSVYVRNGDKWTGFAPFNIFLSEDPIDRYIAYRRIPLVVQGYRMLEMVQRDITGFDEKVYFSNAMVREDNAGTCVNCHAFSNYRTDNMQIHARESNGGTIIVTDGIPKKFNLKTAGTISAGVYPAWHPTHDYIAYSNNRTLQEMHLMSHDKIEVVDEENDIVLYDIKNNTVSPIENDSSEMECFPAWSADGRTLYYASNHFDSPFDSERFVRIFDNRYNLHFNLYAKPFDPETRTWGPHRLVFDAAAVDSSMTWPKLSPDGRYMMACISTHGIFPLDQIASDLFIFDFKDRTARRADEINSRYAESYHAWSSNSKWVMWSTRREDGVFTRLYFSHIDENGHFSKPFALPQKDPESNRKLLLAYNLAEFQIEPISISPDEFASVILDTQAIPAAFESKRETDNDGNIVTVDYRIDGTTGASTVAESNVNTAGNLSSVQKKNGHANF